MTGRVAAGGLPHVHRSRCSRARRLRARVGDDAAWEALFERPLSDTLDAAFPDDLERGIVLTDALIGTFAPRRRPVAAPEPLLRSTT